jgi:hypothetical protein
MKNKSFWNISLWSLILAIGLVIGAGVNLVDTFQVRGHFEGLINTLQQDCSTARQENARLKLENKALAEEAMAWMSLSLKMKHLLGDMEPDIDTLEEFSRCENCCDIGGKIVSMGPRFQHFKKAIKKFLEVKDGR